VEVASAEQEDAEKLELFREERWHGGEDAGLSTAQDDEAVLLRSR